MAIAGKVAITPKGEWNAETDYTKLDLVFYENASYVATKPSTGVEPTNTSYWMLVVQSAGGADLDGIISGDIQVGNAKTLDGHEVDVFAKAADLSNYFPKSGGTINGNVRIGSDEAIRRDFDLFNALRVIEQRINADGSYLFADITNNKWLIQSTLDGVTTFNGTASGITGGILKQALTITDTGGTTLLLVGTDNDNIYSQYRGKSGVLGYLGFAGKDNLILIGSDGSTLRKILHTGNKPTGTYTGNGDATQRIIDVGGVGSALLVYSGGYMAIVSEGAIISDGSTVTALPITQCSFNNGKYVLATDHPALNTNGGVRGYAVL